MAYVPDWERLFDALKRVVAVGVSVDEAKLALSRAIADRKIRVRLTVESDEDPAVRWNRMLDSGQINSTQALEYFEDVNVGVPRELASHDFDWENSRPFKPWSIRPREWQIEPRDRRSIERRTVVWPRRIVSRIEARIADVTPLLSG
jgi:hypothetical protein